MSSKTLIFALYFVFFLCLQNVHSATDKVVCYYANWAVYRPDNGKFTPADIDATVCTHVLYAFLGLNADGTIVSLDSWADIDLGGFQQALDLKKINPNIKLIASVGGWNAGNGILTGIAADPFLRNTLIQSSLLFFEEYGFDGLDIDWEYPLATDKDNFITLLSEIHRVFQPEGFLITAAVSAIPIDEAYDVPAMSSNLDLINLMTYDFHVAAAGVTGQNSPLYAGSADNPWQAENENVDSAVKNWVSRGADPQKLTIGLGFYGHTFQLAEPGNHGVGAPVIGSGEAGSYTKNAGTLGYGEICEFDGNWERVWDDEQKVPYKFNGDQWIGYDDEESIALKVQYARNNNLAGVMMWTVDTDDIKGFCGNPMGLLEIIKANI